MYCHKSEERNVSTPMLGLFWLYTGVNTLLNLRNSLFGPTNDFSIVFFENLCHNLNPELRTGKSIIARASHAAYSPLELWYSFSLKPMVRKKFSLIYILGKQNGSSCTDRMFAYWLHRGSRCVIQRIFYLVLICLNAMRNEFDLGLNKELFWIADRLSVTCLLTNFSTKGLIELESIFSLLRGTNSLIWNDITFEALCISSSYHKSQCFRLECVKKQCKRHYKINILTKSHPLLRITIKSPHYALQLNRKNSIGLKKY